jgi:L-asparagine transporter-like permease
MTATTAMTAKPQQNPQQNKQQPQMVLFIGIALTLLLAFFTVFLLLRINALEKDDSIYHRDYSTMTIEEAEHVLNRNLMTVRSVRRKLEELQSMLQKNFNERPHEHEL